MHFAVVKTLVKTDFYSTLSILFASREDARGHYTDLVFLTGEIYALTFRHCTPKDLVRVHRQTVAGRASASRQSVLAVQPEIRRKRVSGLRSVLRSERANMGGCQVPQNSARWTNRHSGGFTVAPKPGTNPTFKKIIPTRNAIEASLKFNSRRPLQEAMQVNSDILCMLIAKRKPKSAPARKKAVSLVRQDVTDEGLAAIVSLTTELVEVCFEYLARELRERIQETKDRSKADETDTLMTAQKSFVAIIGAVVGFHRERYGKIRRDDSESQASLNAELHRNCMRAVLSSDFKIVKNEWKAVEAGVELESFQLVFRVLVESCESLREDGKDDEKVAAVELSTSAVLEMMKMLQGMTAKTQDDEDKLIEDDFDKKSVLTPREIALNTIEKLFERQSFLNAPAELAKDFNNKMFSFKHLTNIVEVAHAFTTILLDEQELASLQVTKEKRNKRKKQKKKEAEEKNTEDDDPEFRIGETVKEKAKANPGSNEAGQEDQAKRAKKKNKIVESDDEHEESVTPQEATSLSDKSAEKDAEEGRPPPAENRSDGEGTGEGNEELSANAPKEHVDDSGATNHKKDVQDLLLADANDEDGDSHGATASSIRASKKLSKVQQLLLADSETVRNEEASQKESSSEEDKSKEQSVTQSISKVQLMLMADREQEPEKPKEVETAGSEKPDASKLTTVQNMLLADANQEGKDTEMPKLVSTIEEMRREAIKENAKAAVKDTVNGPHTKDDASSDESDNSDNEPELREVESVGIIRRFAHAKALQTLILPIRTALCRATSLTGTAFPIPEESNSLLSPVVIAKSAHVLAAIWRVAKVKDRGVQCGQFFSYSTMHLINIALSSSSQSIVKKGSVLERLSVFSRDVTKEFFTWLSFNPGLSLDLFFPMDKNGCNMYVSRIHPKALHSHRNADEDSGNESDLSLLDIEKRVDDSAAIGSEKPRTGSRSRNATSRAGKRRMQERRRAEREKIVEDEDVDDIDNLDLGIDIDDGEKSEGDSPMKAPKSAMDVELPDDFIEDSPVAPRARKAKRARMRTFDPFDSDDEVLESRMRKKQAVKAKKVAKKVKKTAAKKGRPSQKPTFSSSDEYSDIEIESGMELSDVEKDKGSSAPHEPEDVDDASTRTERNSRASERPPRRLKTKLNFSESPDMLDEGEEDDADEEEPLTARPKSLPPLKSTSKPDTRVLATKALDSRSDARLRIHEEEADDSSAESDAKTSAGIPTPSSEKSKAETPGNFSKDDREPLTPESGSSPVYTKQPHSQRRKDRKARQVVCSDEESD